jgi:hypothetical protein
MEHRETPSVYGLMAEFVSPSTLLHATERVYAEGYRKFDAYTPTPIHGLAEAMGFHRSPVALVVLIGGLVGAAGGFGLCYFMAALSYVHNIGGRPIFSWPSFIPITFETAVLTASFCAVIGMLAMNGLPRPYHPVFNVPRFALATHNRFFLCIEAVDEKFDLDRTTAFLLDCGATEVTVVQP